MAWTATDHFFQLVLMLTVVLSAQAFGRRANNRRLLREAQHLRVALAIAIAALRKLYEANLTIVASAGNSLLSGRNQITLLRSQLGRLISLDMHEVEAVMRACCAAERVETEMAGSSKKAGGVHHPVAPDNDAERQILESTLRETCALLLDAEQLLAFSGSAKTKKTPAGFPAGVSSSASNQEPGSDLLSHRQSRH